MNSLQIDQAFKKDEEKDINLLLSRVRKDPANFKDWVIDKLNEFQQIQDQITKNPSKWSEEFEQICTFFGVIFEYYSDDLGQAVECLRMLFTTFMEQLHKETRLKIIQTLFLLLKKGYLELLPCMDIFIGVFGFQDKNLRLFVFNSLLKTIKNLVDLKKFQRNETQFFIYLKEQLENQEVKIIKRVIKLMVTLYQKNICKSKKLINFVADQIKIKDNSTNIMVAYFLINVEEPDTKELEDSEEEDLQELTKTLGMKYKNSKKKIEKIERQIKNVKKKQKRQEQIQLLQHSYPIDQLYNPSEFVEICMKKLSNQHIKFSLKFELLCLIGWLIGRHWLIQPSFYSFILRFIRPEIKNASRLFAFMAESIHEQTPKDDLEQIILKLIENFIIEGLTEDKICIGVNTARVILLKRSDSVNKEQIEYICKFKDSKQKWIALSAKAFLNAARDVAPEMVPKSMKLHVRTGEINPVLTLISNCNKDRIIQGVELLDENENQRVEDQRLLTDEDFKRIKKLQQKNIVKQEKEQRRLQGSKRAIHMPEIKLKEFQKEYNNQVEEFMNQEDSDIENIDQDEEELTEEMETENFEDFEEIEIEDSQQSNSLDDQQEDSQEDSLDESNSLNSDSEEDHQNQKEFIDESEICPLKKKIKKSQKTDEHFQAIVEKKFANKKKNKKGSKTNREKEKNQPFQMVIHRVNQKKQQLKDLNKGKKKRSKQFKGKFSKRFDK